MKVVREDLEGTKIQRLVVVEPGNSGHHKGQCVGYLCPRCMQADETLEQIYHEEECDLAGEHGRAHYDELEPDIEGRTVPELDPEHPITIVRYGETEGNGGLCDGQVLSFQCTCGNLDEDLFEIVHDEACPLAGQHGRATSQ